VTEIERRRTRDILLFWLPLAATWMMMAVEGPFLAAIIARLADPKFNLAAHGVAFAFAILIEAPVIMLMSASTALVEDSETYRRLRNFANALNAGSTALLLLVLIPPVYSGLMEGLIGLPPEVARLTRGALWILLPWPAAIGYRRFLHGLLIRSGRTRLVALGTVLRLLGMSGTALVLYLWFELPGAWVGAAALSMGVVTEMVATRVMATGTVRELLARGGAGVRGGERGGRVDGVESGRVEGGEVRGGGIEGREAEGGGVEGRGAEGRGTEGGGIEGREAEGRGVEGRGSRAKGESPAHEGYRAIAAFYYPLALTSIIGLTVQPMLTFFMGRAPAPIESLAVFPVVHSLSFLFRALGLSFQEAAIALMGRRFEHYPELARFATVLGIAASGGFALVAFTPLADVWFITVSGLTPELAAFALTPTKIMAPLPALSVLLSFQRAILVQGRRTRPITVATVIEVVAIALLFPLFGWGIGMVGVTAAAIAFVAGRTGGVTFLLGKARSTLP
jgi:Na+-driven multidrug efflux pump